MNIFSYKNPNLRLIQAKFSLLHANVLFSPIIQMLVPDIVINGLSFDNIKKTMIIASFKAGQFPFRKMDIISNFEMVK